MSNGRTVKKLFEFFNNMDVLLNLFVSNPEKSMLIFAKPV